MALEISATYDQLSESVALYKAAHSAPVQGWYSCLHGVGVLASLTLLAFHEPTVQSTGNVSGCRIGASGNGLLALHGRGAKGKAHVSAHAAPAEPAEALHQRCVAHKPQPRTSCLPLLTTACLSRYQAEYQLRVQVCCGARAAALQRL